MSDLQLLTKDEAISHVRRCAFYAEDRGADTVHCFLGSFGADWDADEAARLITETSGRVAFGDHWLWGPALMVEANDKVYVFDSVRPPIVMGKEDQ